LPEAGGAVLTGGADEAGAELAGADEAGAELAGADEAGAAEDEPPEAGQSAGLGRSTPKDLQVVTAKAPAASWSDLEVQALQIHSVAMAWNLESLQRQPKSVEEQVVDPAGGEVMQVKAQAGGP
jgi:hypothetical protein